MTRPYLIKLEAETMNFIGSFDHQLNFCRIHIYGFRKKQLLASTVSFGQHEFITLKKNAFIGRLLVNQYNTILHLREDVSIV